ncbi:MAG: HPr family phosphocarrier protein [Lachnospirales bacterium]
MTEKKLQMNTSIETNQVAMLVQKANAYSSEIHISTEGKVANVKSIMGVISLGMLDNFEITVSANGADEKEAVDFVYNFLLSLS